MSFSVTSGASHVTLVVKNLPVNAAAVSSIPGLGRSPEVGNRTHSSILAWKMPWTEEPGGLHPLESVVMEGVGHN